MRWLQATQPGQPQARVWSPKRRPQREEEPQATQPGQTQEEPQATQPEQPPATDTSIVEV